jgi:hypothetical protein
MATDIDLHPIRVVHIVTITVDIDVDRQMLTVVCVIYSPMFLNDASIYLKVKH